MSNPAGEPRTEYTQRLSARQDIVQTLERADANFANARLAVFIAILVTIALAATQSAVAWFWPLLPLIAFVVLVVRHETLARKLARARRSVAFYDVALARLDDRWAGAGVAGNDLIPEAHPYAADMDLFGIGSLFELLCTARTKAGEQSLARWLCGPAPIAEIRARQDAIEELRNDIDLREELAIASNDIRANVRPEVLKHWADRPPVFATARTKTVARALTLATLLTLAGWLFFGFSYSPFLICLVLTLLALRYWKNPLEEIVGRVSEPAKDLKILGSVLLLLENATFQSPKLRALQQRLSQNGRNASKAIARLDQLVQWLDAEKNMMFAPVAILLLWRVHFAVALEQWRKEYGAHVGDWLEGLGELETLSCLAGFAYERPENPFPEVIEDALAFDAIQLGHPLIPAGERVRNDVRFGANPQALIVSGSNMSGKSTLLRTIGINTALALAGAPVCASQLRLCVCNLGATIRIEDSIQRGASRFYAEITRIKQLFDLTKQELPLLFLLDELFGGTNSHDRGIGGTALIKGLLEAGAMGLVTTHDLALTKLAQETADSVINVHFEDHLEGDKLVFDYRLKDGVVQKSNALELMRAIGLDV